MFRWGFVGSLIFLSIATEYERYQYDTCNYDSLFVSRACTGIYPLGHPRQTQNLHYLVSPRLSTVPANIIMSAIPAGTTVFSDPRVGVVSGTLPKGDHVEEGRRTAPSSHRWQLCGHSIIIVYCYAKRWDNELWIHEADLCSFSTLN